MAELSLGKVLEGCGVIGPVPEGKISGICSDSRKAALGYMFIAIKGGRRDGQDYITEAFGKGAAFAVTEESPELNQAMLPTELADKIIFVKNAREAESRAWYNYYSRPTEDMVKIAVTGTAGKTTVTTLLSGILSAAGKKAGIVTTIKTASAGRVLDMGEEGGSSVSDYFGKMTTPDPEYFFRAVSEMKNDGCKYLIYEASSQSIVRRTTSAIVPDIVLYTNISEEHLDAHGTMENYFAAKAALMKGVKKAIINMDDDRLAALPAMFPEAEFIKISGRPEQAGKSDVCALRYKNHGEDGVEYVYFSERAVFRLSSHLVGLHSVYNTMEAAACAVELGIDPMTVKDALESAGDIDGRMYRVRLPENSGYPTVFIDYAHTPKALEAVCSSLAEIKKGRLCVVFGCGGDRDRSKRPLMVEAVQKYAEITVITRDNPRSEDEDQIFSDILTGADKTKQYIVIPDRKAAVIYACGKCGEGDIILLAGKGHEKYEITREGVFPFDEEKIVRDYYSGKTNN